MRTETDPIHVLHVDDEPGYTDLVADWLEREDERVEVVTATDAEAGLERLDDDIDCVVSDYDMPGRDGIEFLEAVRAREPELPFLLFTGKGSEEVAAKAVSAGATDYLQKGTGTDQYALLANRITNAVERHRSQQGLAERTRRLETLVDNLPGIVYCCRNEPGWPMEYVEGECESLTGHPAERLEDGSVTFGEDIIHPADRESVREAVETALDADEPFEVTYRIRTADGSRKWVWERGRAVEPATEEQPAVLEGFMTDITEREQRHRELREERSFVETVLDTFDDIVYVFDTDLDFVWWNERAMELSGYTGEELVEMSPTDFFADEDAGRISDSIEELLETGVSHIEADLVTKEGERIPHEFRGRSLTGPDEEPLGFCGVARDISERREREAELERYETLIETAADGVYAQDAEGRYTYVNSYIEEVTGYDREELLGRHAATLIDEPQAEQFREAIREMIRGEREVANIEAEVTTADGETVPMEGRITTLPSDDGFRGTIGVIRDISERTERERELERERRRLDEFASVVSHDLRNPLNVAEGRLELARRECDSDQLEAVAAAHDRMRDLIEDLLALAREGESTTDPEPVGLAAVARECWRTVGTDGGTLAIETDRTVRADRGRLRQLLENLFRNALEHGDRTGETGGDPVTDGDDDTATVTLGDLPDGFYVADDGDGIRMGAHDRLFEPGYSTAEEGTGLGLSIVSEIAAAHGWTVEVGESGAGGARFEITGVDDA